MWLEFGGGGLGEGSDGVVVGDGKDFRVPLIIPTTTCDSALS